MNMQMHTKGGKLVEVAFSGYDCRETIFAEVPAEMIDVDHCSIREEFRGRDYAGFFVSPCGNVFRSRSSWADYCD